MSGRSFKGGSNHFSVKEIRGGILKPFLKALIDFVNSHIVNEEVLGEFRLGAWGTWPVAADSQVQYNEELVVTEGPVARLALVYSVVVVVIEVEADGVWVPFNSIGVKVTVELLLQVETMGCVVLSGM